MIRSSARRSLRSAAPGIFRVGRLGGKAAWVLVLGLLGGVGSGCTTNQDLLNLHAQIAEVQSQLLSLQQQTPTQAGHQELIDLLTAQGQALQKANADAGLRNEALEQEIEALAAQIEALLARMRKLSNQVTANGERLETALRQPASFPPPSAVPPSLTPDPEEQYQTAYNDYLRGSYDLAVQGFRAYISGYPDTELADNATYWLGECFYRQQSYDQAISMFDQLLERYPRSDKIPSGLLKKGYASLELQRQDAGIQALRSVARQFPGSDEANLAKQRLQELGASP